MKKTFKILIAVFTVLSAVISLAAVTAVAAESYWDGAVAAGFASGDGSEEDPYVISNGTELAFFASSVNDGTDFSGKYITLTADIFLNDETFTFSPDTGLVTVTDGSNTAYLGTGIAGDKSGSNTAFDSAPSAAGTWYRSPTSLSATQYRGGLNSWTPVGSSFENCFKGNFDGGGHIISGIYIQSDADVAGFFGCVDGGSVTNISIENSYIRGGAYVGGIAAYDVYCDLINCSNGGTVCGGYYVGGLVGNNCGGIINSFNGGAISGSENHVGGIAGYSRGTVINCYNYGSVCGVSHVGGIAGDSADMGALISCYNAGSVSGNDCVGAVSGANTGFMKHCYYPDTLSDSSCATALTSSQMESQSSFAGFDFANVWAIEPSSGYSYPVLSAFLSETAGENSALWNGNVAAAFASGNGTKSSPYIIKTAAQLAFFAEEVNGGNSFSGKYIKLGKDISLNDTFAKNWTVNATPWAAIGRNESSPFSGNFDGNGKTVSGLYISGAVSCEGLFGCVDGTVANVNVVNSCIVGSNGIGGIAGINLGSIKNCRFDGVIIGVADIGGIAGNTHGDITSCVNEGVLCGGTAVGGVAGNVTAEAAVNDSINSGNVTGGSKNAGGIAGGNSGNIENCRNLDEINGSRSTGGIAGGNSGGVADSINSGNVTGSRSTGGIAGSNSKTVADSVNRGDVTGVTGTGGIVGDNSGRVTDCYGYGKAEGDASTGGIAGLNTAEGSIKSCYSTVTVSGKEKSGGIAGENSGSILICSNEGTVKSDSHAGGIAGYSEGSVKRSANSGDIRGTEYIGGISGYSQGTTENCCNTASVTGVTCVGGISGEIYGGSVSLCYNVGSVSGFECVGSVVGNNSNGTVTKCHYLRDSAKDTGNTVHGGIGVFWYESPAKDAAGSTTLRNASQLKQKPSFTGFNFTGIWMLDSSQNSGYPVLRSLPEPTRVTVTALPKYVYAPSGSTARVRITAEGEGLTYEWYVKNKSESEFAKSSVTSSSYSYTMAAAKSNRQIYCVVTDKYGNSVTTDTVTLRMEVSIKSQPHNVYAAKGIMAKTVVIARGEGLTYKWYVKNAGDEEFSKSSVTKTTYSYTMTAAKSGRQVYCVITDKYGNSVTSDTVTFTMISQQAAIVTQPEDVTAASGEKVTVTFEAAGEGLTYQWYVKDKGDSEFKKSSVTKSSYSYTMTATKSGRQVYCVITDRYGNTATTQTVTLNKE